jgi:hypothetical protein
MNDFVFTRRLHALRLLWCALLLLGSSASQAQAQQLLFEDNFNAPSAVPGSTPPPVDQTRWNVYNNGFFIHRTQFGLVPTLGSESTTTFARLGLNTHNPDPTYGSSHVRGAEMFSKVRFPVGNGGVEYEARVRSTNLAPGVVGAFYTFGDKGTFPDTYLWDEIDYEFLGNYPASQLWLNVWDDYSPVRSGLNEASQPFVSGLNRLNWNVYKIRAYPYVTQWLVNDVLVRESYSITPTDSMSVRFNIWAPDSSWAAAYSSAIAPAPAASNASYFFDIDYVRVRALPPGSIGTGTGLRGTYHDSPDFTGASLTRIDPRINFDWPQSPDPSIAPDSFSVRWEGQVQAQFSETYTFTTRSDDGVRLWVNGQKLVDNWTQHAPTENSGSITLVAGTKYDIRMEFYEDAFGAVAQLFWSSPSTPKRIIPASQLYPAAYVAPTPTPTPQVQPTATPVPVGGSGTGLSASYYDNVNFTGVTVQRVDPTIGFDWGDGSPSASIAPDTFSARWTGQVQAPRSERYTFHALADDGVRVWINGVKIIDAWTDQPPTEYSGSVDMVAGTRYDIVVEYYESLFGAVARLRWSSPSTPKAIVPASQLYPGAVAPPTAIPTPTPTATPSRGVTGTGTGLSATYYDAPNFTGASLARVDPTVDFEWDNGSPNASIAPDSFSVRWEGQVQAQFSETYTFTTRSDDGVRLWVNGQKLVDNWTIHAPTDDSGSITLVAGAKYDIRMEFYEDAFGAVAQLFWSSPSTPRSIVPASQLYPAGAVTASSLKAMASTASAATSVRTGGKARPTPAAPSLLSIGSANSATNSVLLVFKMPLDARTALAPARYRVEVNGVAKVVERVSVSGGAVTLRLPLGTLRRGARVRVLWSGLRNSRGQAIVAGVWQGVAN